jgi:hypothetical protein
VVITVPLTVWVSDIQATIRSAVRDVAGSHSRHRIDPEFQGRPSCRYTPLHTNVSEAGRAIVDLGIPLGEGILWEQVVYELDRPTIRVVDFKWYSKPLCEVWRDQRGDP